MSCQTSNSIFTDPSRLVDVVDGVHVLACAGAVQAVHRLQSDSGRGVRIIDRAHDRLAPRGQFRWQQDRGRQGIGSVCRGAEDPHAVSIETALNSASRARFRNRIFELRIRGLVLLLQAGHCCAQFLVHRRAAHDVGAQRVQPLGKRVDPAGVVGGLCFENATLVAIGLAAPVARPAASAPRAIAQPTMFGFTGIRLAPMMRRHRSADGGG